MAYTRQEWILSDGRKVWTKLRPASAKKSTGRYRVQVSLGRDSITGRTRWAIDTFNGEKDASQWEHKTEAKKGDGFYKHAVSNDTFAEFLERTWFPAYRKKVRNSYNTEKTLGKWILRAQRDTPFLGRVKLRDLTPEHFDQLYAAMAEGHGIRPRGIQHVHSILRRAMKYAVGKKRIASNPTDNADVPKAQLGPARFLTADQERRFLTAAKKDRLSALWHLLLDSGLRPGEAFALKWEPDLTWQADGEERPRWGWIDLDQKLVYVKATLTRVGVDKEKLGWKLLPPKTDNSDRDVPINDDTIAELKAWRTQQKRDRVKVGPSLWQAHGFVFTSEVGTPLGDNMGRAWASVIREADGGKGDLGTWGQPKERKVVRRSTVKGRRSVECSLGPKPKLPFTPRFSMYVLRHTMISLNFLDGMDLALLSRRAGHDDPAFTFKRYGRGVKASHTQVVTDNTMRRWRAANR